ncbi:MAG: hypothetical protein ACREVL_10120 [Solimonas sp.]
MLDDTYRKTPAATRSQIDAAYERCREMLEALEESAEQHPFIDEDDEAIATLSIDEDTISIECLGKITEASPRLVRKDDERWAVEYVFVAEEYEDEPVELFRFYVDDEAVVGQLGAPRLADYQNTYLAQIVIGKVYEALLESDLLKPMPVASD